MRKKKMGMDEIDLEIFEALQNDARLSSEELSKKLNISGTTIRRRLRILLKNNIIRIVAIGDFSKIGLTSIIGIHMEVEIDKVDGVVQELVKHREMQSVAITSGQFNISTLGAFVDNNDFKEFMENVIAKLKGVKAVETMVFLDVVKGRFFWGGE